VNEAVKRVEQKAFRSYWDDGLLDIMLGLVLLVLGITWWQGVPVFGAIFPAACVSMWSPLRKRLVEPRMGYVEFSGKRNLKVRGFRFGLMAFFAGAMLLGLVIFFLLGGTKPSWADQWIAGFPLVLIAIPALFFALFTNCLRFVIYAFLLLLAGLTIVLLGWDPHMGFMASGLVILPCGLVILSRFLARHPKEPDVLS
jgi:hypothetical protein